MTAASNEYYCTLRQVSQQTTQRKADDAKQKLRRGMLDPSGAVSGSINSGLALVTLQGGNRRYVDLPVELRNNVPISDASLASTINLSHLIRHSKGWRIGQGWRIGRTRVLWLWWLSLDPQRAFVSHLAVHMALFPLKTLSL